MIPDNFSSLEQVSAALKAAGVEKSQLVVGVDFTASNKSNGKKTFGGRSLHDVSEEISQNPYEQALSVIAQSLWDFDDDHMIPAYGFGDLHTGADNIFSFNERDKPCKGLTGCTQRYREIARKVHLAGPTSFAPIVRQAVNLVTETNEYHILLIIADGQVTEGRVRETAQAIAEASNYALSIIMVGVGDGPWNLMDHFDDKLPGRRFDNFQFVEFNKVFAKYPAEKREAAFATHALMEVPEQYQAIKRLGLLRPKRRQFPASRILPCSPPDSSLPSDPWHGLPDGWDSYVDQSSQRIVYVNTESNVQTWVRPTAEAKLPQGFGEKLSESTASTTTSSRSSKRSLTSSSF